MIKHQARWQLSPSPMALAVCAALAAMMVFDGCAAAKPACTVINIADAACGAFVAVKLEDGTVVSVPVGEIRAAAKRTQLQQGAAR